MEWKNITCIGNRRARYALFNKSNEKLFVIGVNPSTADDLKADPTMNKVMGFSENMDFDGFCMLNLYPQRTSNPDELHKEPRAHFIKKNAQVIYDMIYGFLLPSLKDPDGCKSVWILCAWGNSITKRSYLKDCLKSILEVTNHIIEDTGADIYLTSLGLTKEGHPRHPLYVPYSKELENFDIETYFQRLMNDGTEQ